jgi:dihydropteroate synthase
LKLQAGQFEFAFPRPALVMGIINVTPDSFSDGGQFLKPEAAVARAFELVAEGAEIIDIGGESTRPGAQPVSEAEELCRVLPVLERLRSQLRVPVSIDTMKVEVARAALEAGASIVNDVGANRTDPAMWRLVAQTGAGYVCMHIKGTPQTMQAHPAYTNLIHQVGDFFADRLEQLSHCGVRREQIIMDPGIGFGKTLEHNVQLLGALRGFTRWERPLLLGVSRKSFLAKFSGAEPAARLPAALACACLAVAAGVCIIRAHEVRETVAAIRMAEAILKERIE